VIAEPAKLKQVLVNLISNAVKYTLPGGWIVISTVHGENDDFVKISVKDTGIGIKPEDQSKIFHEKYYRTDESKKTGSGGAGVGLIVCRRLVEQFGGKIGVESEPGKGSTFWVTIPSSHSRRGYSTDKGREGDHGKEESINRG
jgi:two-component system sensor histidine kinase BarA